MNISLAAEPVFYFWGIRITNSLLTTWLVTLILIVLGVTFGRRVKLIPTGIQNAFEGIFQAFLNLTESVAGEKSRIFFPLVFTLFVFILLNNWFGLLPGIGSLGFYEVLHGEKVFIPFFRAGTSDLNMTLALAMIAMFTVQYYGVKALRLSYFKKFLNFSSPLNFYVGILETVSELSKIISFSFRLFGNIFAGEVLLIVMAFLLPVVGSLPFFGLELFVGFIQALVFSMLTLVFLNVATVHHED